MPVSISDHSMVHCTFILSSIKPKSAHWHFNTNLLNYNFFKDSFKSFWNVYKTMKCSFHSLQQWWDFGKVQRKQFTQQYTYNVIKELTRSLVHLEKGILECQKLAQSTGEIRYMEACSKKKAQLEDLEYRGLWSVHASKALIRCMYHLNTFSAWNKIMGRSVLFMHFAQRMEGCCQTLLISVVEQ